MLTQALPECLKVTSTGCAVHPTPQPQSPLSAAQSSCCFLVPDLCCCCFLLWAEFYTVCQSPERHTLEGPVEWDTKSDPPGEQLVSHLLPLSLFVSLYLPPFLSLYRLSFYLCLLLFFLQLQQLPGLLAKFEQVRSPLFANATLHLLARWVLERSAKPSPTSHSVHRSECAANEHDWRNVPAPVLCLFFLFDKFRSQ